MGQRPDLIASGHQRQLFGNVEQLNFRPTSLAFELFGTTEQLPLKLFHQIIQKL